MIKVARSGYAYALRLRHVYLQSAKSRAGILLEPMEGASSTPFKPKYFKSPMNADAPSEKARLYPQKNHWKLPKIAFSAALFSK